MNVDLEEEFPRSGLVFRRVMQDYLEDAGTFGTVSEKALCKVIRSATLDHNYQEHDTAMVHSMASHHVMLEKLAKEAGQPFDVTYLRTLFEEHIIQHARVDFSTPESYGTSLCKHLNVYPSFVSKFVPCSQEYVLKAFELGKWDDQTVKKGFRGPNKEKLLIGLAQTNEVVFGEFVENRVTRPELEAIATKVATDPKLGQASQVLSDANRPFDWKGLMSATPLTPELAEKMLVNFQPEFLRLQKGRESLSCVLSKILEGDDAIKSRALGFALWNPQLKGLARDLMDLGCPTNGHVQTLGTTFVQQSPIVEFMLDALVLGGTSNKLGSYGGEILENFEYAGEKGYISDSKPGTTPLWKRFLSKVDTSMVGKGTNWDRKVAAVDKVSKFPAFEECVAYRKDLPEGLMVVLARRCPNRHISLKMEAREVESDISLI